MFQGGGGEIEPLGWVGLGRWRSRRVFLGEGPAKAHGRDSLSGVGESSPAVVQCGIVRLKKGQAAAM